MSSVLSQDELRSAVIFSLVRRLGDVGKTKIQKLVYMLQAAYELPLGCNFFLHQYGPYSEEVDTGISNLSLMGYIAVRPDPNGYGYHLTPVSKPEPGWMAVEDSLESEMSDLLGKLGAFEAWELELVATIHFLHAEGVQASEIVPSVESIKPKFQTDFVVRTLDRMVSLGYLS